MEPHGIIHNGGNPTGPKIYLPLEQLEARAIIIDIGSRVSLTQRYYNPSDRPTSRAVYSFPVPARAAICSFELRTSGGKVLSGICKEKTEAREEFEDAVAQGKRTALLELISGDVFTISIGSISAKETVYVNLVFVMNLMNDHDRDFVRFYLPVAVGQRYGTAPEALNEAAIPSAQTRLKVKIDVQTSGSIRSITSPTHTIKVEKYNTNLGRPSRRRAIVTFRTSTFLTDDFVLLLQADELDAPRCFAQIYTDPRKQHNDTFAVQLTVVPKFNMPPIRSQEYIFLVDRSGSMDGNRIETAKKTLTLLLRMLPQQGSYFNVFSFGNHADSLWARSNVYDQYFLDAATEHVKTMAANYGGTEILLGLDRVFRQRNTSLPTAVFVLTDGEAHNVDEVVALVRSAVQGSSPSSPLRVYTLGIGSQVSSAMCEGIASSGNGTCLLATRVEDITAKCARLLRAGRTPFVKDVHVDWGVPATLLASHATTGASSYTPQNVQQAPTVIHDLHADVRLVIFAIFQWRKGLKAPQEVILRGKVDGTGEAFQLVVPVRGVQLSDFDPLLPPIHTLAALHLIREHEAGLVPLPRSTNSNVQEARKQAIVYLGTRYQLVSRHTSFVAIDKGPQTPLGRHHHQTGGLFSTLRSVLIGFTLPSTSSRSSTAPDESANANLPIPGGWPGSPRPINRRSQHSRVSGVEDAEDSDDTAETYSTMSSLEGSSSERSYWTDDGVEDLSEEDANLQRSPSPQFGHGPTNSRPPIQDSHIPPAALLSPQVSDLLSLQRADGAFILDESMKTIVGQRAVEEGVSMGVNSEVWATVLCVAFLHKHLTSQNELRNDLLVKAYEFLQGEAAVDDLLQRAMQLVL